ncbi:hypothetical protein GCM10009117_10820 [Gangjinia marincola]|uniref:Uncharacterized protein n=1 Tax=Gangjinia marincola TaxID=578463 RepID=A0ABN1MGJ9_9FLAO
MKVSFLTKEESKRQQEEDFLALSQSERMVAFFNLIRQSKRYFPTKSSMPEFEKSNFVIEIKSKINDSSL